MDSTNKAENTLTSEEKKDKIVEFIDDIKADRIEVLDVRAKTSVADFFIVCTGNSDTHVNSITERALEKMRDLGIRAHRSELSSGSGWALVDFGDVVLNVMREERRQFYDLESLWNSMQPNTDLI